MSPARPCPCSRKPPCTSPKPSAIRRRGAGQQGHQNVRLSQGAMKSGQPRKVSGAGHRRAQLRLFCGCVRPGHERLGAIFHRSRTISTCSMSRATISLAAAPAASSSWATRSPCKFSKWTASKNRWISNSSVPPQCPVGRAVHCPPPAGIFRQGACPPRALRRWKPPSNQRIPKNPRRYCLRAPPPTHGTRLPFSSPWGRGDKVRADPV